MDNAGEHSTWRKYYINVCRPLNPVPGCDRYASVCQMKYKNDQVSLALPTEHVTQRVAAAVFRVGLAAGASEQPSEQE